MKLLAIIIFHLFLYMVLALSMSQILPKPELEVDLVAYLPSAPETKSGSRLFGGCTPTVFAPSSVPPFDFDKISYFTCQNVKMSSPIGIEVEPGQKSGQKTCIDRKSESGDCGMDKVRLKNLVKEARGERSQREFAKYLGVAQPTVSDWERGNYAPSLENTEILAKCLGITLTEFIARAEGRSVATDFEALLEAVNLLDWRQLAKIQRAIADRMELN
jgi:transcriptional regulator with XRE-family HTH domain